jgi:hypothetical protein
MKLKIRERGPNGTTSTVENAERFYRDESRGLEDGLVVVRSDGSEETFMSDATILSGDPQ